MKTKKVSLLMFITLLSCVMGKAQAPKLDWLVEQKIGPSQLAGIAQEGNNLYKAGTYTGTLILDPAYNDTITSSYGGQNEGAFIVKYDTNGNYMKGISLNAISNGQTPNYSAFFKLNKLAVLSTGSIIVTGEYRGTPSIDSVTTVIGTVNGKLKGFIMCFDSNLNFTWGNSIANLPSHTVGAVLGGDLFIDDNQNIYASYNLLYPANDSGFYYGLSIPAVSNNGHRLILKINATTGNLIHSFPESSGDAISQVCADEHENIYFTRGGVVHKRDPLFNTIWAKNYMPNIGTELKSLIYHNGSLYILGTTYNNFDAISLTHKTGFFAKIDTGTGNLLWSKLFTEPSSNSIDMFNIFAYDTNLFISGTFKKTMYFNSDSLVCDGGVWNDVFLFKYGENGNELFKSIMGGPGSQSEIKTNEQGKHLYVSLYGRSTTNFVLDGSAPQYLSQNYITGLAKYSFVSPVPPVVSVNLGNDTAICVGSTLTLSSGLSSAYTHLWSTGDTSNVIIVFNAGNYWVQIFDANNNNIAADTINISIENLNLWLGNDTTFTDSITISSPYTAGAFQWSTGSFNSSITVNTTGTYWLYYVSPNGCSYTDSIYVQKNNTTAIYENLNSNEISLYPNPTNNQLYIKNIQHGVKYAVIDVTGKTITKGTLINNALNVSGLNKGLYTLLLFHNNKVTSHPFIKK